MTRSQGNDSISCPPKFSWDSPSAKSHERPTRKKQRDETSKTQKKAFATVFKAIANGYMSDREARMLQPQLSRLQAKIANLDRKSLGRGKPD